MVKKNKIRERGVVTETLSDLKFRVKLEDSREILAYLSGRMRHFRIKILPGDKVTVETSPYDKNMGRIIYREK